MKSLSFIFAGFILSIHFVCPQVINVPADYPAIQQAIDVASKGDTIIVDEGIYYENIRFRGKSLVVASKYILDQDIRYISTTIIDGSKYQNIDSASCVIFEGEDSLAVLQGFTLQHGMGTVYNLSDLETTTKYDGKMTHEGGGVFFNESNAALKNNLIINNQASGISGFAYCGGGGISSFRSNPLISNNVITGNKAVAENGTYGYAGALVFNESHGIIRNNIFYDNYTTGRGTVFIDINLSAVFENNTIVGNTAGRDAPGLFNRTSNTVIRNNLIWGNIGPGAQILGVDNDDVFEYCITTDNIAGDSTILKIFPEFEDEGLRLQNISPCIDKGKPDPAFNDKEDSSNPGKALSPSMGGIRNDIGAYGGPFAGLLPEFSGENIVIKPVTSYPLALGETFSKSYIIGNLSTHTIKIDSIIGPQAAGDLQVISNQENSLINPLEYDTLRLIFTPTHEIKQDDSILIYHNGYSLSNPIKVSLEVSFVTSLQKPSVMTDKMKIYPNPASEYIKIETPGCNNPVRMVILNCSGVEVFEKYVVNNQQIDISKLSDGLYIVKFDDHLIGRFVKMS